MSNEVNETIEEKRRKNVMDNQQFLQSLHLSHIRDDLKSSVTSVRKKPNEKKTINPEELRRSTRIRSIIKYDQPSHDEDVSVSSDDPSTDEENDEDLSAAFMNKIDDDWQPIHHAKIPPMVHKRPIRKAAGGVKIFEPNIGLQASKVLSNEQSHHGYTSKKLFVAISSSSEEEN